MSDRRPRLVVLVGPTASGKTALGIDLAVRFGGEILSADSRQVVRRMDIGTGKPSAEDRARVPHHLLDLVEPDQVFHAAAFRDLAGERAAEVSIRGHLPFVVGGTGLYVRALLKGLCPAPPASPRVREVLEETLRLEGAEGLHRRLAELDPATAARVRPTDPVRIVRALEVLEVAGVPLSRLQEEHRFAERPYRALSLALDPGRAELSDRIEKRVDRMLASGLRREVEGLLEAGYAPSLPSLTGIGYREMIDHLAGRSTEGEAREAILRRTLQYAKRQRTWFRAEGTPWFHPDRDRSAIFRAVEVFLEEEGE